MNSSFDLGKSRDNLFQICARSLRCSFCVCASLGYPFTSCMWKRVWSVQSRTVTWWWLVTPATLSHTHTYTLTHTRASVSDTRTYTHAHAYLRQGRIHPKKAHAPQNKWVHTSFYGTAASNPCRGYRAPILRLREHGAERRPADLSGRG